MVGDASTIAAVWAKLAVTYGARLGQALGGADPATVKRHWAHELRGMPDYAIAYGLANLPPSFPPNVLEFKALCQRATAPTERRITHVPAKPSPEVLRRVGGLAAGLRSGPRDPLAWARSLKRRHEAGDKLTRYQIDAYKQALRLGVPQ